MNEAFRTSETGRGAAPGGVRGSAMVRLPGAKFTMGSDAFYREERPAHDARVADFWIDVHPVTNAQFAEFVEATGHVTLAERQPDAEMYPHADPELLVPGSLVFRKPGGPVDLRDHRAWWTYLPGADWRHPAGPGSDNDDKAAHPVVHVAYEDACAYAAWAGKALPTEAEWEYAARGGLVDTAYAWGDEFEPKGRTMANTWHGRFPWENLTADGHEGTSPIGSFPANGFGLLDMIGNVWEWTASPYTSFMPTITTAPAKSCCVPSKGNTRTAVHVVKGGSHLCAPNYCLRYRPSARQREELDTTTSHIGFRCILRH